MFRRICACVTLLSLTVLLGLLSASYAADPAIVPLRLSLELYDEKAVGDLPDPLTSHLQSMDPTGAKDPAKLAPLDPKKLKTGENIMLAIQYSGLGGDIKTDGLRCMSVTLLYDAKHFKLNGFDALTDNDNVKRWDFINAQMPSERWVPQALKDGYSVHATVAKIETESATEDIRGVRLQYVAEATRDPGYILTGEDDKGFLGAFSFTVLDSFTPSDNVKFSWAGLNISLYEPADLSSHFELRLRDAVRRNNYFVVEPDLQTATTDDPTPTPTPSPTTPPGPNDRSIKGVFYSYNASADPVFTLIPKGTAQVTLPSGDSSYYDPAKALNLTGRVTVTPVTGDTQGKHYQSFEISGVPDGTYQLCIKKPWHLQFTLYLTVNGTDYDISASAVTAAVTALMERKASAAEQAEAGYNKKALYLCPGDLDGNGQVTDDDAAVIYTLGTFGGTEKAATDAADIDGNGQVTDDDAAIIYTLGVFGESMTAYVIGTE